MHRQRTFLAFIVQLLLCLNLSLAWAVPAAPVPVPPLSPSLLIDQTGKLNATEKDGLVRRLKAIQDSGQAQIAILVSSGIEGEPLSSYSLRVVEAWRLGRAGRDNGLLILVIPSTNAARIEVGYGLEGVIPDALASRWVDELILEMKIMPPAAGLTHLLDEIDSVLPGEKAKEQTPTKSGVELLEDHPEWVLPFFLLVASPMSLIPLFLLRRGYLISGPLLALLLGLATWAFGNAHLAPLVSACALPLPYLWSLNGLSMNEPSRTLVPWQIFAKHVGNVIAVVTLFATLALLLVVLLPGELMYQWIAVLIAAVFAISLATFLFPGQPARYLSQAVPGVMFFAFFASVAYFALQAFVAQPIMIALAVAGGVTALLALMLYLDSAEKQRTTAGLPRGIPWSLVLCGISLLAVVPFALLALLRAATGDDWHQQLIEAISGGGALTGVAWLAARVGLFTAVGLGGLFGGGGAGRG